MEKFEINNIETTLIKTNKFKTITFFVVLFGDFTKENATQRNLLAKLLQSTTKNYPTKKAVANKLFDLYDANIFANSFPMYKTNLTVFGLQIVNPSFVQDDVLLNEAISFFKEMIFNPNVDENGFNLNEFNEKKRNLRDNINNIYNNKTTYAFNRLLEIMGPDEIINVNSLGTLEDLEKITPESLKEFYDNLIKNEMAKIYVTGDIDQDVIIPLLNDLNFSNQRRELEPSSKETYTAKEVRQVSDTQNINQAQLMMGFRTNTNALDELYVPMAVFNMMFGGMVSSDLFRVVREENSLAYSVGSSIFFDNRLLIVSAGIDAKNYELATDLIIKELEEYKQGKVDSDLLQVAKDNLNSSLSETADDPFSNLTFIIKNSLLKNYSSEDIIELVKQVTVEDIVKASRDVELDVIYCLKGEENGSN